jgi:flagellar biosynthesis protein FlhF
MIQKIYRAGTLSEAVATIKREMGTRAVIVSTSKVMPKRSFFRTATPTIEVIAAVDENTLNADQLAVLQRSADVKAVPVTVPRKGDAAPDVQVMISDASTVRLLKHRVRELEVEVASLRSEIVQLNNAATSTSRPAEIQPTPVEKPMIETAVEAQAVEKNQEPAAFDVAANLSTVAGFLKENGFDETVCQAWHEQAQKRGLTEFHSAEDVLDDCATYLMSLPVIYKGVLPRVIGLVGPAGAGKTMTTLKLAHDLKRQGKRAVIVTLDVKREDSIEQLKAEAEELGVPFCVMHPNHTIEMRLRNFSDCDHILIDTPSFVEGDDVQTRKILRKLAQAEAFNFLVLSGDDAAQPWLTIANGDGRFVGAIINRIDECFRIGGVFNTLRMLTMPVAYFGIGRNVADDIEAATPERLLSLLFRIDGGKIVGTDTSMSAAY